VNAPAENLSFGQRVWQHIARCFLAGVVAVLPVAGLIILIYMLDSQIRGLFKDSIFDFPGIGLVAGFIGIYALGLTLTTFIGRWLWRRTDGVLSNLPVIGMLFRTLKQILGYGSGKDGMFHRVVLVPDAEKHVYEIGLVTEEITVVGEPRRLAIFMPGSPNPTQGKLILIEAEKCVPTAIKVDVAMKALISTGKTGL
jgi:uncharacterized membrane protein